MAAVRVRFEPIGEEIDCSPQETVLDAAFRHGYNLAHGCREGQCSACKCFLLEGDVALKPHSSFALSDSERASGYALMCRAMPEQDLVIELLHYDPDNYRLEHPIRTGTATVRAVEALTDDIRRVVLDAPGFSFTPGQFVDLHVDGARRSFSMANVDPGRIELIVKRYPGGRFSGKLDGELGPGAQLQYTGPFGALRAHESQRPILMVAAGAGIAPILSLLRHLEATGSDRPVRLFFANRQPLCSQQLSGLGLRDFSVKTFADRSMLAALDAWLAENDAFAAADVYMCGPPAMLQAAEAILIDRHGIDARRIFQDRFTTAAEADPERPGEAAGGAVPAERPGAAQPSGEEAERTFSWYVPRGRRATLYEDVTVDTQPSIHRHLRRGWPVSFEDGRGTWQDSSTALRSSDWYDFRDPGEQWERPFYQIETAVEQQIEGAMRSALQQGLIEDFRPQWAQFLRRFLQIPAFVEHGLWFALATAGRDCLSDSVATCVCLQAAMKQRSAQAIVLYAMDLEEQLGPLPIEAARAAFLAEPHWQPTRGYLERLAATADWGEVIVAANLCFEPVVATLLRRELGIRAAAANGDTITPVLARAETQEWEWARAWTVQLTRFLLCDPAHGSSNRAVITGWVRDWLAQAIDAAAALAPLAALVPVGIDGEQALERARADASAMLAEAGLEELCPMVGHKPAEAPKHEPAEAPEPELGKAPGPELAKAPGPESVKGLEPEPTDASERSRPAGPPPPQRRPAGRTPPQSGSPQARPADGDGGSGTYDYVGIVMAKSAEGDAVARILARRDDIVVHEQPAFWDIRARERLVIPYEQVSEELGYEIDAYSIQHEMSTHYGRMVATDAALMLFSDPAEAIDHLLAR